VRPACGKSNFGISLISSTFRKERLPIPPRLAGFEISFQTPPPSQPSDKINNYVFFDDAACFLSLFLWRELE